MICFFSSGESIEVSPVDPMIRTADVPCRSWKASRARNASKSTAPDLLKGVIRATKEPVRRVISVSEKLLPDSLAHIGEPAEPEWRQQGGLFGLAEHPGSPCFPGLKPPAARGDTIETISRWQETKFAFRAILP